MSEAVIAFISGIVTTVIAFNFCRFSTHLRSRSQQTQIPYLTERRDASLRRVWELRRYANFCELEAKCWPEHSLDHDELVVYAKVARRLADESLREWREIERKLRAERFEQITSR